jgi:DNA-directed RNA polymerase specialized sigma24 family protein
VGVARHLSVSTRSEHERRPRDAARHATRPPVWRLDPVEEVAVVARARRELLLRMHRHRLRREDLEDCYSQATLELLADARRGAGYGSRRQIETAIERRFVSRIQDRRRALSGRSPMQAALEASVSLAGVGEGHVDVADLRAQPETLVILRLELRRVQALMRELSPDQRLVLISQVALQMPREEFCRRYGWSADKYRKVARRARARLARLMTSDEADVPTARRPSEEGPGTNL